MVTDTGYVRCVENGGQSECTKLVNVPDSSACYTNNTVAYWSSCEDGVMNKIFGREPVLISFIVSNGLSLAMAFGFKLSAEQVSATMVFVNSILTFVVRGSVTPTSAP